MTDEIPADEATLERSAPQRLIQALSIGIAIVVGWTMGAMCSPTGTSGSSKPIPAASGGAMAGHNHGAPAPKAAKAEAAPTTWTCSMHPQVQLPEPGACPICGMDLIPAGDGGGAGPEAVSMSESAKVIAGIETTVVSAQPLIRQVALTGEVVADETRISRVAAWFGGRIEKMHVDYVGAAVSKGDPLFDIYSPELLVAQRELLEAARRAKQAQSGTLGDSAKRVLKSAKERLRLWGLRSWQVKRVLKRGVASPTVTVFAPQDGIVISRNGLVGSYVETGSVVYELADLSKVWLALWAFDEDLPWLSVGQIAQVDVPGSTSRREGTISFIAPTVERRTRTTRVRVAIDNSKGDLRPGAWVRAHIQSPWADGEHALVIPASAPLIGRNRSVVFVTQVGAEQPTYLLREVVLGPMVTGPEGDVFVVKEGLMAGEAVVSEGAFKLDSSLQIRGDRSLATLLNEDDEPQEQVRTFIDGPRSTPFIAALGGVVQSSIVVSQALGSDDVAATQAGITDLVAAVRAMLAVDKTHMPLDLVVATNDLDAASGSGIKAIRDAYVPLSLGIALLVQNHRDAVAKVIDFQLTHCPMAGPSGSGAMWLQAPGDVRNPYYGKEMLTCGEAAEEVPAELVAPLDIPADGGAASDKSAGDDMKGMDMPAKDEHAGHKGGAN